MAVEGAEVDETGAEDDEEAQCRVEEDQSWAPFGAAEADKAHRPNDRRQELV